MTKYTPINVETLILVAVWNQPFVFQGSFKLTNKTKQEEHVLFYRCECFLVNKFDIREQPFSAQDYQFTHLYKATELNQLLLVDKLSEDAIYLLKYALYTSLTLMLKDIKQYMTYMDEIAIESLGEQVKVILQKGLNIKEDDGIGFAVSMDFEPAEEETQAAVESLLSPF